MKFAVSIFAFAASLAFVSAQDFGGLPTCATQCFILAAGTSGCSVTDMTCLCTTGREKITSSVNSCVPGKCSEADIAKIAPATEAICKKAGVTISNVPTAVTGTPTGASTQTRTGSATITGVTGAATQSPGAGSSNIAGMGAVALGLAAVFGL